MSALPLDFVLVGNVVYRTTWDLVAQRLGPYFDRVIVADCSTREAAVAAWKLLIRDLE